MGMKDLEEITSVGLKPTEHAAWEPNYPEARVFRLAGLFYGLLLAAARARTGCEGELTMRLEGASFYYRWSGVSTRYDCRVTTLYRLTPDNRTTAGMLVSLANRVVDSWLRDLDLIPLEVREVLGSKEGQDNAKLS